MQAEDAADMSTAHGAAGGIEGPARTPIAVRSAAHVAGLCSGRSPESGPIERAIDVIVCDVGDVLILFPPGRSAAIERRYGIRAGGLLNAALKAPSARLASVGQISQDEWVKETAAVIGLAAVRDWLAYHGELNRPVAEILTTARRSGILVMLLSNATVRLWDDLDHHGIRYLADKVYCSADIGLAKPDPRVYELVISQVSVPADRVLYVDDTASWVQAGRRLGMRGYAYGTARGLRHELASLGGAA
jgi:putative hydrolase of the HAD superfamily